MRVFVCDNYDSFTFNLVQYLGELGATIEVARNDEVSVANVARRAPDAVVISPGPGGPAGAGMSVELVRWCASSRTPLLGVCLGHQCIAEAFGGRVVRAPAVVHGKSTLVHHTGVGVLAGLPNPLEVGRYHSLRVEAPDLLEVTAWTEDGVVMGVRHPELPVEGVQFHPESILTPEGKGLLRNFLATTSGRPVSRRAARGERLRRGWGPGR